MSEVNEQVVELDDAATKAIAAQVAKSFEAQFDAQSKAFEEKIAALTVVEEKEVNKLSNGNKEALTGEIVGKYDKESKEEFAVKQLLAALSGNREEMAERNDHALKTLAEKGLVTKATYLNATTDADGGYFVPSAELLTDVLTILPDFSPLAGEARVINLTSGEGIDVTSVTTDVILTEVGSEGGSKAVTKPVIGDTVTNVREFAGIALLTKKLVRQAVVDVYAVLRDSFARAIADKREELLLTDSTSGIVTKSGVFVINAGGGTTSGKTAVAQITWKEVKAMPFAVPTKAARGGMYAISRLLAASLDGMQDSQNRDLDVITWDAGSNMTGTFKNGYRFAVAENLGVTDAVSTVHAVFGNFSQYAIVVRQGAVDSAVFDSGTVTDGSSVVHNLIQENKLAMRVEIWENVGYPLPGAFARLRTSAS